ncbi:MAG: PH domain-containing protein [Chloroflexota bacterium]
MGSYAETLLAPGEIVVHRSHQHVLSLILNSRFGLLSWAVAIVALLLHFSLVPAGALGGDVVGWVFWAAVGVGILLLVWHWWQWRTEEYLITNRRLMKVTGIINKRSADSSLEKINDAILEENLIGRILDYGDLDILTAADIAVDRYRMLAHAKDFKKRMLEAKHALETGMANGPVGGNGNGVARPAPAPLAGNGRIDTADEVSAALAQLAELRDRGAISAEDYEAKKQDLLGRI